MKINNLKIENFRCFREYSIDFAPEANVLIGKNGSGKSTLLDALKRALSFVFSKSMGRAELSTLSDGMPALGVERYRYTDLWVDSYKHATLPRIAISAHGSVNGIALPEWSLSASANTLRLQDSAYRDAYNTFNRAVQLHNADLPLLAYYSDGFPHIDLHKKSFSLDEDYLRNYGYYAWSDYNSCLSVWLDRYAKAWKKCMRLKVSAAESDVYRKLNEEISAVASVLVSFMAVDENHFSVRDLVVDEFTDQVSIMTEDGVSIPFSQLPAGYRRLLGICMDLAYRSFILNRRPFSPGIALIDEIDLHLHPSLERDVLQRFRRTFPDIQFIVSTHSPLVVTNLNASDGRSKVMLLTAGAVKAYAVPNLMGVDYNFTLRDVMGTPDRDDDIQNLVQTCLAYKELGMNEQETETRKKIEQIVGSDPSLLSKLGL